MDVIYSFGVYRGVMNISTIQNPDSLHPLYAYAGRKEKGEAFELGSEQFITQIHLPNKHGSYLEIEWDSTEQVYRLRFEHDGTPASITASGFRVILD